MSNFPKGSEWRRWELHIHTPDTLKNDNFKGTTSEQKWNGYYDDITTYINSEVEKNISVIAITDYLSIDNYLKVKSDKKLPQSVGLILPNVELRILPVTGKNKPINIHCIFSPDIDNELEGRFFSNLTFQYANTKYTANKSELIRLGKKILGTDIEDRLAINKASEQFVISLDTLTEIFKNDKELRDKTIIVVSNSSNDGVSGISGSNHCDYLVSKDKTETQLETTRYAIYNIADAIFSSSEKDIAYFAGDGVDNIETIQKKYGGLKPCFHGSDAHENSKIFSPDQNRFCWIKSDLTFEGLKHAIQEPKYRVFIGEKPPILKTVEQNKTKYIKSLSIDTIEGKENLKEAWFESVSIPLNSELVAIIGNKGSGKSAIADIIGLCADSKNSEDFLFLDKNKFKKKGFAERFSATLEFESGTTVKRSLSDTVSESSSQKVRYLPQSYFEKLCNQIEKSDAFKKEIESVVFQHLSKENKLECGSFEELINFKNSVINKEINSLNQTISTINNEIIALEDKKNPKYKASLESQKVIKEAELVSHTASKPPEKSNPSDGVLTQEALETQKSLKMWQDWLLWCNTEITKANQDTVKYNKEIEKLNQLKREILFQKTNIEKFISERQQIATSFDLNLNNIIKFDFNFLPIDNAIEIKNKAIEGIKNTLVCQADITGDSEILGDDFNQLTTASKLKLSELKIKKILDTLDSKQKDYQAYLSSKKAWEDKELEINGTEEKYGSLAYLKAEIKYIDTNLQNIIKAKRNERLDISKEIHKKKIEIKVFYDELKKEIGTALLNAKVETFKIKSELSLNTGFTEKARNNINLTKLSSFYNDNGTTLNTLIESVDWNNYDSVKQFLEEFIECLEVNKKRTNGDGSNTVSYIDELVKNRKEFYDYLFSLSYLVPSYQLQQNGKNLEQLSPGEKGALLLIFYLVLDQDNIPLIIDQPEDNLDNHSVATHLVPFLKEAKKRRQIIIVTHNPNLAVYADAEQIIRVKIDKENGNRFSFSAGSIENPDINKEIVEVLEGTMPAFSSRSSKYHI